MKKNIENGFTQDIKLMTEKRSLEIHRLLMEWMKNGSVSIDKRELMCIIQDLAEDIRTLKSYDSESHRCMLCGPLHLNTELRHYRNYTTGWCGPVTLRDETRYNELLYSVGNKYPDESRHETALRYIKEAESSSSMASNSINNLEEKICSNCDGKGYNINMTHHSRCDGSCGSGLCPIEIYNPCGCR